MATEDSAGVAVGPPLHAADSGIMRPNTLT